MKHLRIPTNPVALHPCIVHASATTDMSQLPRASCHRWSKLPPAGGLRINNLAEQFRRMTQTPVELFNCITRMLSELFHQITKT